MQSGEPGDGQRERNPQLADLIHLCASAAGPTEPRVLLLSAAPRG
jgi:hypothetical protein